MELQHAQRMMVAETAVFPGDPFASLGPVPFIDDGSTGYCLDAPEWIPAGSTMAGTFIPHARHWHRDSWQYRDRAPGCRSF